LRLTPTPLLPPQLFTNTFPNTLDTTVGYHDASDSFIITGDIDAMWLRDSCNQVLPYLPFIKSDDSLDMLLSNLVMRMSRSVLIDSYANAFNFDGSEISEHASDERIPMMSNFTFEGKVRGRTGGGAKDNKSSIPHIHRANNFSCARFARAPHPSLCSTSWTGERI